MNALLMELYRERNVGVICKDLGSFSGANEVNRALKPARIFKEIDSPNWQANDLLKIMEMLISSRGTVDYSNMCSQFGEAIINSMIEYNLMHVRPTATMAFDIPWHGMPIITPELPAAKVALTRVLSTKKA